MSNETEKDQEIARLRQSLWNVYGILGFDQDGAGTPRAVAGDICELVENAAREHREESDRLLDELQYGS